MGRGGRRIALGMLGVALIGGGAAGPDARAATVGAQVRSFARITTPMVIKGFDVTVEFDDVEGARAYDDPAVAAPTPTPTGTGACLIAQREKNQKRKRVIVQEGICPGDAEGYQFNHATMQARLAGTVPTQRWTRIWKVVGNRWKLVTDKYVAATAAVDIVWQAIGSGQIEPTFCGFGPGLVRAADANVQGSVRFNGLKLSVPVSGMRGAIGWSTCGEVNPFSRPQPPQP